MKPMSRSFTSKTRTSRVWLALVSSAVAGGAVLGCGTEDPQPVVTTDPTTSNSATVPDVAPSMVSPTGTVPGPSDSSGPDPTGPGPDTTSVNPVNPTVTPNTTDPGVSPGDTSSASVNPDPMDSVNPTTNETPTTSPDGPDPVTPPVDTTTDQTNPMASDPGPDMPPPDGNGACTFSIEDELSSDISTVGIVNWSTD